MLRSLVAVLAIAPHATSQESSCAVDLAEGIARLAIEDRDYVMRFTPFALPAAGRYELSADAKVSFASVGGGEPAGLLVLEAFSTSRLAGVWSPDGSGEGLEFDLQPTWRPNEDAAVRGAPDERPRSAAARDIAKGIPAEDLVFCALGGTGTGLPGQHRIAQSMIDVAERGALDFVLLLGDAFPGGVAARDDAKFQRFFETSYPSASLPVPFWLTLGAQEHAGDIVPLVTYGSMNLRWSMPQPSYDFIVESHGQRLQFVSVNTIMARGPIRDPRTRRARSAPRNLLDGKKVDWRIVFGYEPLVTGGQSTDEAAAVRRAIGPWLKQYDVDVYVAGCDRSLQLLTPEGGVPQVISGAGGGAEVAQSVDWTDDTRFAATGGGSTWFRFDGTALEITFRNESGDVLFVHRLER